MSMTKTARAELRTLVKQRFKVLRADVQQRRKELLGSVDQQVADRFADQDRRWDAAKQAGEEVARHAQRELAALWDGLPHAAVEIRVVKIMRPFEARDEYRDRLTASIRDTADAAKASLDRQEVALLERLAVGDVEPDGVADFLALIPTVGELVPAARLSELEASIGQLDENSCS